MTAIRVALPSDLDEVIALESRIFGEDAWSPRSVEAEFDQQGESRMIVVATDAGKVVGYAVLMYADGSGDLPRIAVAERHRRLGVASRLLAAAVDHARDRALDQVLLEVAPDNRAALALYTAYGFEEIDRRRRYYSGERDAVVMRLLVNTGSASGKGDRDG